MMQAEETADDRRRNRGFTQVYERGWDTISGLAKDPALRVFLFIAKHAGRDNALICPIEVLAEELGISERTVHRATRRLQDEGKLTIVKVGTANAYILDPRDLWKGYDDSKRYCAFGATTLASKARNPGLKRRLTAMIKGQPDLFEDDADPAEPQSALQTGAGSPG